MTHRPDATLAERERDALADTLLATGPDAPTLCEGWTTRDLARHLVLREGDPKAVARLAVAHAPALRGKVPGTEGPSRPFAELVDRFRSGPALPVPRAVDTLVNTAEHFIHHEDVRRAQPGWSARPLDEQDEQALWAPAQFMARRSYRRCPVGVVLVVPDGPRSKVRRGAPAVVLTGRTSELVLYVTGRRPQADVALSGPDDAVAAFRAWLER